MAVDNNKKGFSGLSDLVSEVQEINEPIKAELNLEVESATPPKEHQSQQNIATSETDRQTLNSPPPIPVVKSDKSGENTGIKWIFGIIGVIFVIWLINSGEKEKSKPSYNSPSSSQSYSSPQSASRSADQTPVTSQNSEIQYTKPSIGTNNVLSVSEIRWCLRQSISIDAMRDIIETNSGIDEFNRIVNDHNSRCGSYRYRSGSHSSAESDVEPYRSQIIAEAVREARRLDSSFQSSTPSASSSPSVSNPRNFSSVRSGQSAESMQQFGRSYQSSTPSAFPSSSPKITHNSLGSRNVQDVKTVQQLLTDIGFDPGLVDGILGDKTKDTIVEFQRTMNNYVEDGRITDSLINDLRRKVSINAKTKEVQKLLSLLGYNPGSLDGKSNFQTTAAIIAFERHQGRFYGDGKISDQLISDLRNAVSKNNVRKKFAKSTSRPSRRASKVTMDCGEGFVGTPEGGCKPMGL